MGKISMTKMVLEKVKQLSERITSRQYSPPWTSGSVSGLLVATAVWGMTGGHGDAAMLSAASGALLYTEDLPASEAKRIPGGKPRLRRTERGKVV